MSATSHVLVRSSVLAAVLMASVVVIPGCRKPAADQEGPTIVEVGDEKVTAAELIAKLNEQPAFVRSRYASAEARKEVLDGLIQFEVLLAEAKRRKLDQDPEFRATYEKLLVQRLVQKQAEEVGKEKPSEEELRAYYEAHLADYVRPDRLRVTHILLSAPSGDAAAVQRARAEAEKLVGEIRKKETSGQPAWFSAIAQSRSEHEETKAAGGDLGFKTREELEAAWGADVAQAVASIKNLGEIAVATSPKGVHLLKLIGRQPGLNRSFDDARPQIESRAQAERRAKGVDALVQKLKEQAKPKIDEKALAAVEVDPNGTVSLRAER